MSIVYDQPHLLDVRAEAATHTITSGPDKWELLLAIAEPGPHDVSRRRPEFRVEAGNDAFVYPLRIDELRRLDELGTEWEFAGRVDKAPDFDNYDSDGCHRAVRGTYDTRSRTGTITLR
jgi:hypothetical protein